PPPPDLSPLSLHDALPISSGRRADLGQPLHAAPARLFRPERAPPDAPHPDQGRSAARLNSRMSVQVGPRRISETRPKLAIERVEDRKSTRLNSSHDQISYA